MTAVVMMAGFIVIPNIPAYVQKNLGYPRDRFELLYLVGGAVSLLAMRVAGATVDRYGEARVGSTASIVVAAMTWLFFVVAPVWLPVMAVFIGYMMVTSSRNVPYDTLTSKVPSPGERARSMSIQSMVQHIASGAGSGLSGLILATRADGSLDHLDVVAWISIALGLALPFLFHAVERRVTLPGAGMPAADPSS